jgi:chromosome segregation protein
MKIRRLEIQGFKSFADRTVLRFGEGITGVVGPNGCGKSNIVDAIRWVMGEQSAKHLRGSGMQDVIFSGSESRGPSGFSEVTLTFKNDGSLVPPEYQRCEEISVTRRLFRDGTSEYAINKVPCRLRDVLDLFMGTGIGKNAYSIIEQGRIGLIVTAKPEDRRAFIEDAAGVSRYKARRKQAERRIEATEQNLLRVNDITEELSKRLDSLEKQAKKAEKYRRIKDELRALDLHNAAHRHLELGILERYEAARVDDLRLDIDRREQDLEATEVDLAGAHEAATKRDHELRLFEAQIHEHQQAFALAENNVEFLTREQAKLSERIFEAEAEKRALIDERALLDAELSDAKAVGSDLDESGGREQDALARAKGALDDLTAQIAASEKTIEAEQRGVVSALTEIAAHETNLTSVARQSSDLAERVERSASSRKDVASREKELEKKAHEIEATLKQSRQLELALQGERSEQEAHLERLRAEVTQGETLLLEAREELLDKRSRLNSLLEIQRNYEGCTAAVRTIMRRKERDPELARSLHGLVADVVSADARFEAAIEAVLGERLQSVIVNSQSDGVSTIDFLKQSQNGRSSFIPLDLREDHASWAPRKLVSSRPPSGKSTERTELPAEVLPSEVPATATGLPVEDQDSVVYEEQEVWPDLDAPGVCGKLVDLVRAQPGYEHVARVLLGDVVVVEELSCAQKMWRENGHRKTLVTLSGEVLDPVGVLTGGFGQGVSAGILAQKREINDLGDAVRMLEAKVTIAEERHQAQKQRIVDLERTITRLDRQKHQGEISIVGLEQDLRRLREDLARAQSEKRSLGEEIEAMRSKLEALLGEERGSKARIAELVERKAAAEAAVSRASAEVLERKSAAKEVARGVTDLEVSAAQNREKRDSSKKAFERAEKRLGEVIARLERIEELLGATREELARVEGRIAAANDQGKNLGEILGTERTKLDAERERLAAEMSGLSEEETALRTARKDIEHLKEELGAGVMRTRELELARQTLAEQIDERYRLRLADVIGDFHLVALQSDEHRARTEKLRRQIDNIGPINLTAIEEYEEVKSRYEFLSTQKKDLEEAIESLRVAIKKINKTSKERYVEAFRLVNEKFEEVFPKLFNGGRASLVMTDEADPLESGIEMLAQPPGKKLQNVSLLSGGEKALTAVALIFAIFLIKPTPFCLLDEVDAPLDEANVGRYNEMVRGMAAISQFILITHNKRTMELPDRLYGVTMEEPGISKIVPVDVGSDDRKLRAV